MDSSTLSLPKDAVFLKTRSPTSYIVAVLEKLLNKYSWTSAGLIVSSRDYETKRTSPIL